MKEYEYIRHRANIIKGRTKETHLGVAAQAEKMRGRTKENNEGVKKMAEALTGRTKETHPGIAKASEKKFKLPKTERNYYFKLWQEQKMSIYDIYNEIKDNFNNITISYIKRLFDRIQKNPSLLT